MSKFLAGTRQLPTKPRPIRLRDLMLGVAACAGFFFIARIFGSEGVALSGLVCLASAWVVPSSMPARDAEQRAARRCCAIGVTGNLWVGYLALSFAGTYSTLLVFCAAMLSFCLLLPAFGAWLDQAKGRARWMRTLLLAGPVVAALGVAPFVMTFTWWPLRLAFAVSRPALDRLADAAAAGTAQRGPQWAGLFWVERIAVDRESGNVGLITMDADDGHSGLMRLGPASTTTLGPIFNHNINLPMDARWRYQESD
jgi:hypothetical protein